MEYFKLEFSLNRNEIGDYPQIQKFRKGYDPTRKESCSQIGRYFLGKSPDVEIDFDCLGMSDKAKLTDYMSSSYLNPLAGLLVSGRLYEFLSGLRMPKFITYGTSVFQKDSLVSTDYRWIHFIESYPEIINYSTSKFFLDHSEVNYKEVSVKSFAEYEHEQDIAKFKINAKRLVLKREPIENFDVLRIGVVKSEVYIGAPVKSEMTSLGFTGITFEPADYLIIE